MAYDPSILSKIGQMGPNPVGAMQDAYTLKNVIDTSQINQMKLNEERQAVSDQNTLRSLASKYDLSKGEGQAQFFAEAAKVNPSMAMKLQREFTEMQSGQTGLQKAQLELYAAKNDIIGNALLPIAQRGEELKAQGKTPQEINALMLPLVTQAVGTLKQQTLPNGKPVLEPQDLQQAQQLLGGGDLLSGVTGLVVKSRQSGERLHQLMQEHTAQRGEQAKESETTTILGKDGKPHRVIVNKITGEVSKDLGIAESAERPATPGGGRPKPPAGYEWDPDDPESLRFIPGGPKDPTKSPISGREGVMFSRVASSANEAVAAIQNIVELPVGASSGVFGIGAGPGHGMMSSSMGALTNAMASQDVQDYNTMLAGVRRNLATIETAGLAPSGALTEGFASLELRSGDTELTKMRKLAEMRQVVEKGLEVNLDNPRLPEEQKTLVKTIISKVQAAVPFTQHDVTEFQKAARENKRTTLTDYMQQKGLGNTSQPTPAPSSKTSVPPAGSPSGGAGAGPSKKWKMVGGKLVEDK